VASASTTFSWSLDAAGNFNSVTANGTVINRTHNKQNEVTQLGGTNLGFDGNGNTTSDNYGKTLVYDAWNRLVAYKNGGTTLESLQYDGLNRRIIVNPGTATDLYYSSDWRMLEEQVGGVSKVQYVWSPVYLDALILRDRDADGNSANGLEERLYVQQDANWNVTALLNTSGTVVERYAYDPYGYVAAFLNASWGTLSGSAYAWIYLHQGGRFEVTTGLYYFRNRDYSPTLSRWMQNDPMSFAAGDNNLYRDEGNNPVRYHDPSGLELPHGSNWPGKPFSDSYRNPWDLKPNWSNGTGDLVYTGQADMVNLCHVGAKRLQEYEDYVWKGMKTFKNFNSGNIAWVSIIQPDANTIARSPELAGALYAGFTTVDWFKASLQSLVSGDGPNGAVYVRLFVDEKARTITAITLGQHMIVGIRQWKVSSGKAQGTIPGFASKGEEVVTVQTEAWERRNGILTNVGFSIVGKDDMLKVWRIYLGNIASDLQAYAWKNHKDFATSKYIQYETRELDGSEKNPFLGSIPKEFRPN